SAGTPAGPFLLADVDGDGRPDVLTVYFEANQPYQLGYFKGNPDGTFSSLINVGASPSQGTPLVSAGDLNSDGIPDLTFLTPSGLAVSLGQSGPSFGSTHTTISGGSMSPYSTLPTKPVVGDFNGDGLTNTSSSATQSVAFSLGNGIFSAPVAVANSSPIVADFNRDGRIDIINVSGMQIVVSLGQSNNTFVPVTTPLRLPFDTGLFN